MPAWLWRRNDGPGRKRSDPRGSDCAPARVAHGWASVLVLEPMSLDEIITDILRREGGWTDHPADRGGPTNRGVTLGTLSLYLGRQATIEELKNLTEADARALYRDLFVIRPGYGTVGNQSLLGLLVDMGVNHGTKQATKMLQRALGVKDDGVVGGVTRDAIRAADNHNLYAKLCAERARFYGRLITNQPSQAVFAAGWLSRLAEFIEAAA